MRMLACALLLLLASEVHAAFRIAVDAVEGFDPSNCRTENGAMSAPYNKFETVFCAVERAATVGDAVVYIIAPGTYPIGQEVTIPPTLRNMVVAETLETIILDVTSPIGFQVSGSFAINGSNQVEISHRHNPFDLGYTASLTLDRVKMIGVLGGDHLRVHGRASVTLVAGSFTQYSQPDGGAIVLQDDGVLNVYGTEFSQNIAADRGGAIYAEGSPVLTLKGAQFTKNSAGTIGGAVYYNGPKTWSISDCIFDRNTADNGGGIYAAPSVNISVSGSTFTLNTAHSGGAGLYLDAGAELTLAGTAIDNSEGFGVDCSDASVTYVGGDDNVRTSGRNNLPESYSPRCINVLCKGCDEMVDVSSACTPNLRDNWNEPAVNVYCSCPDGFYNMDDNDCAACGACPTGSYRAGCGGESAGVCTSYVCTPDPLVEDGDVAYSDGSNHGSEATLTCNVGFKTGPQTSKVCNAPTGNSGWGAAFTCTRTRCNPPLAVTNGDVQYSGSRYHNTDATFRCDPGYQLTDASDVTITCTAPSADSPWPEHFAACEECPAGSYSDAASSSPCQRCPSGSSSPPGATSVDECVCVPGYEKVLGTCQACRNQTNCTAHDPLTCAPAEATQPPAAPPLVCTEAADGFYVDGKGLVRECSVGCATCAENGTCTSCVLDNAEVPAGGGLCVCEEGLFGDGATFCTDLNPCEAHLCDSDVDAEATCRILSPYTYECLCTRGHSVTSEDVCVDTNGCFGDPCNAAAGTSTCTDKRAPQVGNLCQCGAGFLLNADTERQTCEPCPPGCSTCLRDGNCTACFDANARLVEGACNCSTGYYLDSTGGVCRGCAVDLPGCSVCESSAACLQCGIGELTEEGTCLAASGSIVEGSAEAATSEGLVTGLLVGVGALVCILVAVVVILAIVASSKKTKKNKKVQWNRDSESTVQLEAGTFGAYLQEQIAKSKPFATGGFGAVYKIKLQNGNDVALKVLDEDASEAAKAEFHREASILTKLTVLDSMYIVPMACFCEDPVCLGMEYASGGTLQDVIKNNPPPGEAALGKLALDTANPIHFLHSKGFAHLDIKPHNYLIMGDGRMVICDFGLAMEVSEKFACSTGTPQYLAPERYYALGALSSTASTVEEAERMVLMDDPRKCDVFSWGIMLHALCTGDTPFCKMETTNIPSLIADKDMRPSYPEGASEWAVNLSTNCWRRQPAERPGMDVVVHQLSKLVETGDATTLLSPTERNSGVPAVPAPPSIRESVE